MAILTFAATHEQFSEMEAAAFWQFELEEARRRGDPEPELQRIQNNVSWCMKRMEELDIPSFAGNHALAYGWGDRKIPFTVYFSDWMASGSYNIYDTSVARTA